MLARDDLKLRRKPLGPMDRMEKLKMKIREEMKMMHPPDAEAEEWNLGGGRFQFPIRKTMRHLTGVETVHHFYCSPTWRGS